MCETTSQTRTTPKRRKSIRAYRLDDEAVLYDTAHHTVHYLNTTAGLIWDCCDGSKDFDAILQELAEAFGQTSPIVQMRQDIHAALHAMQQDGLIDFCEAAG
jgi:PqqD family protein of HPr-rel-A system